MCSERFLNTHPKSIFLFGLSQLDPQLYIFFLAEAIFGFSKNGKLDTTNVGQNEINFEQINLFIGKNENIFIHGNSAYNQPSILFISKNGGKSFEKKLLNDPLLENYGVTNIYEIDWFK